MKIKRSSSSERWIPLALAAALFGACDSGTAPESDAVITGAVEETTETPPSNAAAVPSYSLLGTSEAAAAANTVVVGTVRSDGSLDVISEAEVGMDGRYTISNVPVGRTDLIVSARASNGEEVGRVIVRERTRSAVEVKAAPINSSTTVEGLVYARLRASGASASAINTGELALFLRLRESTAADVSSSASAIGVIAEAFLSAQEAMTTTLASAGSQASISARADFLAEAAAKRDRDRHSGASAEAAGAAFVDAAVDAYLASGITAEALVLATAAATAELDRAMAEAHAAARLDIAKDATSVSIRARQRLAAELPTSFATLRSLATTANTAATVRIGASLSFSEFVTAVREEEEVAEEAVFDALMTLFATLSAEARAEFESRLEAAFIEANLSGRLDASASVSEKAEAIAQYRQDVRAAVDVLVDSLPDGASLDADATVKLLIAVRGGPSFV